MSIVIDMKDRRKIASNLLHFPRDCQRDSLTMSALKGSVQTLHPPGVDIDALMAIQARERLIYQGKQAWLNWCHATDAVLAVEGIAGDPAEHMLKYIQDRRGKAS